MSAAQQLCDGAAALELELPPATQAKLLAYLALLQKWNRTYNLTAIREAAAMVTQHLLDSLAILSVLPESVISGARWADVGSGAGLPGIPLALVRTDLDMTLIETADKKSAFQRQAKIELGLVNVTVINARVETLPGGEFDAVVSRAFSDLADFVALAGHLPRPQGQLYAMKGVRPDAEIMRLPPGWRLRDCHNLSVPGLDAQRHLIVLERL